MSPRTFLAATLLAGALCVSPSAQAESSGQDPNRCAHVDGKPVFKKNGFSHVVRVRNTCTAVVTCEVWTNVDEEETATVQVPAHAERQTSVRDGSPVSLFRAKGKCAFEAKEK